MPCPSCGTENREGAKFCVKCGHELAPACPSCGSPYDSGDLFCAECGHSLGREPEGAAPPESRPTSARVAERRFVSVLFADLVGFTTLSETRDAEEVRELLSRYFESCRRLISLYGGTLEKFIGDAVMAVWGTPVAQEDDAERAVRAALDLVVAVSALGDEVGAPRLQARAGVLAGEAAVTLGAEGEGMVAGDLVNTASRIQSVAEPGTVLVGELTKRASNAAIEYADAGLHKLKGKAEPLPLFRALRVTAGRKGALKGEGLEPPFVGRERELRLLKELFHASAEERTAHLVAVVGIAGIGKSRLGWEFYKYIDGLAELVFWHRGRCLAYGEGVTYWALADMVRMRSQIAEGEEPESARAKLRAMLEQRVADRDDRAWIEPRLAQLLGLEDGVVAEREDLFAAWRLFFERLAEQQPVVLVFEDMQWADSALLEFVEYVLEWSRSHPIFIITLARPELQERQPGWSAGRRNFSALTLEPLSPAAMEALIDGLVPGLSAELRAQVLARAEGVPLYAVETVRMLLDRGLIAREGDRYRPSGPIGPLEVPETLHALVAARLDGLPSEERSLLQDASVLGKSFTRQALAALNGAGEERIDSLLLSLVRKEVLSRQSDRRSPERGQYGFLQDLLRQVSYETLGRLDRKRRHLLAAEFLERRWGSAEYEVAEIAASHYLAAIKAAPQAEDAPAIAARARTMLARAGERAASLAAPAEAERYFRQAADLADEPLHEATLRERAGEMAWAGANPSAAREQLGRALALFEAAGATHPAARVSTRLGEVEWQSGELRPALARMEQAFAVLAAEEPDADVTALAAELGRLHYFRGDLDLAEERITTALTLAERLWLPDVLSHSLNTSGAIALARDRPETALALMTHALAVAREHDLSSAALRAYYNLAEVLRCRDRYAEALARYEEGLALARKLGYRFWERLLLLDSTSPLLLLGRWDEAAARLREVPAEELVGVTVAVVIATAAELEPARGRLDEAERALAMGAHFEKSTDVQESASYAAAKAAVRQAQGRHAEALQAADEAMGALEAFGSGTTAERIGFVAGVEAALALGDLERAEQLIASVETRPAGAVSRYLRAQAGRLRGRLLAASGEHHDDVERHLATAAARFRELGLPFWTAVTELELGEWLASHGRADGAAPLFSAARATFEQLQATPWLDRAVAAGAQSSPEAVAGRS